MSWWKGARSRLRAVVRRGAVERELAEELELHVELETERNVLRGMDPAEARRLARIALGGVERSREAVRDLYPTRWLEDLAADARLAARGLARSPGFAAVAILTLGLAIGATTAIFAAVEAIVLRALPYRDAPSLFVVYGRNVERGITGSNISYPDYQSWKAELRSLSGVALFNWWTGTLAGDAPAERVTGAEVTADFFPVLGVEPLLGRGFAAGEEVVGRDRVVVLGHGLWQRRFGGDPAVLGRTLPVDGEPRTVVGVMPPGFYFPSNGEAWIPLAPGEAHLIRGNRFMGGAVARLAAGVGPAAAQTEMEELSRRLEAAFPEENRGWDAELVSVREDLFGALGRTLLVLSAAVGLVLLVACANVANLLLARGATRRQELALRTALGAGRLRLVRQLLAESFVLAACGGAVGLAVAGAGTRYLERLLAGRLPTFVEVRPDLAVLGFALAATAGVAVLVGLVPALRAAAVAPRAGLEAGSRTTADRPTARLRRSLVVGEVALTVVLVVGALLLVRSLRRLDEIRPGFEPAGVLTARYFLPGSGYEAPETRRAFTARLLERLAALPGVEAVAAAQGTPYSGWNVSLGYEVEGEPPAPPGERLSTHCQAVTPGFFRVLGVPLLRGGDLPAEVDPEAPQIVINETLAARHFAGRDPIGKRLRFDPDDPWSTVVGVVTDFRHFGLIEAPPPAAYFPYAAWSPRQMTLALRTAGPPAETIPALRAAIAELDAGVPAFRVETLEEATARQTWVSRVARDVLAAFAAAGVVLALLGLYGVLSYAVHQQRHEIGVRLALGASRRQVSLLVLRQGIVLAALGVVLGWGIAFAGRSSLADLLFEVSPTDAASFALAPLLVAALATLATALPAWRAASLDPVKVLRSE